MLPADASRAGITRGFCQPTVRLPVVDMIDVRVRARSGWVMQIVCAIMPPIETPTR